MDKKEQVAKTIIENLGGKANINNAWHCMTRLRFDIKDESLIKEGAIKDIPEVVGAQNQNNQYQIIIGTDVDDYFQPLAKELGIDEDGTESDGKREKRGLVAMFMDIVSGVFGPIVPAIAGAGMIKGLSPGWWR
ncbi:PTS transporter subunit EIIB [Listeria grayi]|uniref:PTS transporter subunit EIIB n=1 Tax=Listeria grayi TaxID=1641 RepID=UPI0004B4983F|nr:PTS transporter subunit EIIB [Listeria grayi]